MLAWKSWSKVDCRPCHRYQVSSDNCHLWVEEEDRRFAFPGNGTWKQPTWASENTPPSCLLGMAGVEPAGTLLDMFWWYNCWHFWNNSTGTFPQVSSSQSLRQNMIPFTVWDRETWYARVSTPVEHQGLSAQTTSQHAANQGWDERNDWGGTTCQITKLAKV